MQKELCVFLGLSEEQQAAHVSRECEQGQEH